MEAVSEPERICFAVSASGTAHEVMLSAQVSRAYDIMTGDGVPAQKAADLAVAAERNEKDPVAFAEHFVKLRRSLRR